MEPIPTEMTQSPMKRHHGIVFWVLVGVVAVGYLGSMVWIYGYARGRGKRVDSVSEAVKKFYEAPARPEGKPNRPPTATSIPTNTPTPTPRPTGPGPFACSAEGDCNQYSDEARKQYCTTTFADSLCLDSCADPAKRCTK